MSHFFLNVACNFVSFVIGTLLVLMLSEHWATLLQWQFWVQDVVVGIILAFLSAFVSQSIQSRAP
tara:strand:- start:172 stop:366 length:195 start_codon:yes stop_codon:yes gene_type:complete